MLRMTNFCLILYMHSYIGVYIKMGILENYFTPGCFYFLVEVTLRLSEHYQSVTGKDLRKNRYHDNSVTYKHCGIIETVL